MEILLFASMSCEHVTAYWMICLQLLLHPLGSGQYNYWKILLSASMSCEHVTAYWMICLQLLLHPLGSGQYNYWKFFIRIHEL